MNVAILTPQTHVLSHRVRGSGFYIENLKKSLLEYDKKNNYFFPLEGEELPKNLDLIHYPYFEPFFITLPIIKKTKSIVTIHDLTPLVFPEFFPKGLYGSVKWQIQKRLLKNMDSIITDSLSSKRDILKYTGLNEAKVSSVYLSASDHFRKINLKGSDIERLKKKYNLPEKFAMYVGDVTWNKNLPRLVSAIKEINITLLMVGSALAQKNYDRSNPWNQDLLKVEQLSKGDKRIIVLGFVDKNDLVALYNLATVFVMPSLYEGFGLPVLEAMSCGCPVITSKGGSLREVGGDGVYYVDPYDVNDIANGIGKVYFNNSLAAELSKKGLSQSKKFSLKNFALDTVKVYEST